MHRVFESFVNVRDVPGDEKHIFLELPPLHILNSRAEGYGT